MLKNKIGWGILGCGRIANKFASDLKLVADARLVAVGGKDRERATAFARAHGADLVFNSYDELAGCGDVDAIYIATPHGFHYEHAMLCLRHRKAVLCEKAFALNSRQVNEMITFARAQAVFLMEAFWTKFLPQYEKVMELVRSGKIGDVRMIHADFGFNAGTPKAQRLYDPVLGGGSLLDIGIYPVFLSQMIFGKPVEVHAAMTPFETGVDEQIGIILKFEGGRLAVLSSTFAVETPVEAMIAGTLGRIHMRNRFHNAIGHLELVMGRDRVEKVEVLRESGFGYQFEARHVGECIRKGLVESPVMTHNDSLALMETLDRIRKACGITYYVD